MKTFRFKKYDAIGSADANEDKKYLKECFYDTGNLKIIVNCETSRNLILGRTGSGKTALINQLAKERNAILLYPESLSFSHLMNSTLLKYFLDIGIKLDLFFKQMWKHILISEIIKLRYNTTDDLRGRKFFNELRNLVKKDKSREQAIKYLLDWEDKFWTESESKIKEYTNRIESEIRGGIKSKFFGTEGNLNAKNSLSEEERIELHQRGQEIVNAGHMRELSKMIELLDEEFFNNKGQHYYICIDKLDEEWIDDKFRYTLIKSLVETVKEFGKIKNVKIVLAIRQDLLDRVFRQTRTAGFQEEKFRDMYVRLNWQRIELYNLIEIRMRHLFRSRMRAGSFNLKQMLPMSIDGKEGFDYMLERSFYRPREIIEFVNLCIDFSINNSTIVSDAMQKAEEIYSKRRLRSLQDEWFADYPHIYDFSMILKKIRCNFHLYELLNGTVLDFCYEYCLKYGHRNDELSTCARNVIDGGEKEKEIFLVDLFKIFYKIGIVGYKPESFTTIYYSYMLESPSKEEITINSKMSVHPTFFRVFGINPNS